MPTVWGAAAAGDRHVPGVGTSDAHAG
ncbi:MAG: hypothetical protein RDA78_01765 [Roseibium sp.]